MEADSTTYESSSKTDVELSLPFNTSPGNYKLYKDLMTNGGDQRLESHLVERLQRFGLLPGNVTCPISKPDCKMLCKSARVIDRVQWICESCGKRQPVRAGSFFFRLQCSLQQALQIILAWCEDADIEVAAEHFGMKSKVATLIYDRLDELAVSEHSRTRLGGVNSVVMAEMYPDCVNRLSPDTTDQPHVHRILMLADTNHIPTSYKLHVIRDDNKNAATSSDNQTLKSEVEAVTSAAMLPNSVLVTGNNVPLIDGASSIQHLLQYCDIDMQRFLSSRIWRGAVTLCAASRDECAGAGAAALPSGACAPAVQRYLHTALYRRAYGDGFYDHMLRLVATHFTDH